MRTAILAFVFTGAVGCSAVKAQSVQQEKLLEEVVVDGLAKSTEVVDKQGVSYTQLDSTFILRHDVRGIQDMAQYVPALEVPRYGSRLTSAIYVRGIGSRINAPSVGVYYENIPLLFQSAVNRHYWNVDKMTVLRGPQGTLYGLNSEGGLISIDGRNPISAAKKENPLTAHLGFSTHFGREAELGYAFQICPNLAFTADVFYRGTDGYQANTVLDRKADGADEAGAKVKFLWNANRNLQLSLFAEYQHVDEDGFCYGRTHTEDGMVNGEITDAPATNMLNNYKRDLFDLGVNVVYNKNSWRLQSTTSFQYLKDDMVMDQDYTAHELLRLSQTQRGKALTEEITLKGNATKWWRTSSGIYGSYRWLETVAPVYFDKEFTGGVSAVIKNAMAQVLPPEQAAILKVTTAMDVPGEFRTPMFNLGVFHESHFQIAKDFSATVGVRYDLNRQEVNYLTSCITNIGLDFTLMQMNRVITSILENNHHLVSNQVLPKVSLRYKDFYLTAAKGYRAGGYNIQMFSDILQGEFQMKMPQMLPQIRQGDVVIEHDDAFYREVEDRISYDPETSWNFEFGGKNTLCNNNRMAFDIRYAVFYSIVNDIQLAVMADKYGYGRMMKNAGKSKSCGGEINLTGHYDFNPPQTGGTHSRLTWSGSYSYTYTNFLEDKYVPYIPAHTVNAAIGYEWKRFGIEVNMNGRGKTYWDEENTLCQPFYAQLGAKLTADFKPVFVSLWARNITNYRPSTFSFRSSATGEDCVFSQIGEPFMMGVSASLAF
ncbi:MAG: TonB-dependent receptor [Bacteroidaceae bacterium]|nr:TonB-dependent receptor [Bacteroidaceae bacterium]